MEQDEQKRIDEADGENENSELTDQDLEGVAGGNHGAASGTPVTLPDN